MGVNMSQERLLGFIYQRRGPIKRVLLAHVSLIPLITRRNEFLKQPLPSLSSSLKNATILWIRPGLLIEVDILGFQIFIFKFYYPKLICVSFLTCTYIMYEFYSIIYILASSLAQTRFRFGLGSSSKEFVGS